MATTTKGGDYLGRALQNNNPGVSAARDYLGRPVLASNKDSDGRSLTDTASFPPPDWATATAVQVGAVRKLPGVKEVQTITASGTPVGPLKVAVEKDGVTRTTANISTVNAANIESAIAALDNVDDGDVTVGGTGPWTVTWQEELGNVPQIACNNTGVTGGSYAAATTTQGSTYGALLRAEVAGTTHASTKPTAPAVGKTVVDGSVTWRRLQ